MNILGKKQKEMAEQQANLMKEGREMQKESNRCLAGNSEKISENTKMNEQLGFKIFALSEHIMNLTDALNNFQPIVVNQEQPEQLPPEPEKEQVGEGEQVEQEQ